MCLNCLRLALVASLLGGCITQSTQLYDFDGDGVPDANDCNPADDTIYPEAPEILGDNIDQDCDGADGDADDLDADGHSNDEDCAPLDGDIHPGVEDDEYGDGIDEDCSGHDGTDLDDDGYPAPGPGVPAELEDCNDNDNSVHPGATEIPGDDIDNNCDGGTITDDDGDGYSPDSGDCNDDDPSIHPGVPEQCNDGVDDDCNALTHEQLDGDGDGLSACEGDCDDSRPVVAPDVLEICDDGLDNDCDGSVDNDCIDCHRTVESNQQSIQQALSLLADGDTLCIYPGDYTENLVLYTEQSFLLLGVAAPERTVIDGGGTGSVLEVTGMPASGTAAVMISRLWLKGGDSPLGGGLHLNTTADVLLESLIVTDNHADTKGGGIFANPGSITASNLLITDNSTGGGGGGLFVECLATDFNEVKIHDNHADQGGGGAYLAPCPIAPFTMSHFELRGNSAGSFFSSISDPSSATGAGIHSQGRPLDLSFGEFHNNSARYAGGGLFLGGSPADAESDLRNLTFWFNTAESWGGAMYFEAFNQSGQDASVLGENLLFIRNGALLGGGGIYSINTELVLQNTVFLANHSGEAGGAIYLEATSGPPLGTNITNALMSSNYAGERGGALFVSARPGDDVQLHHATFADNYSNSMGGAIYLAGNSAPTISHTSFVGNHAGDPADSIFNADEESPPSVSFCNFWEHRYTESGEANNFYGIDDLAENLAAGNNTQVDPLLVDSTSDYGFEWDTHLRTDSPLVDAGAPSAPPDPDGSISDIGALSGPGANSFDLDGDGYPVWWQPGPYDDSSYPSLGWDCRDFSGGIHPGATEITADGVDSNCDGID